jgi:hypothetical protein
MMKNTYGIDKRTCAARAALNRGGPYYPGLASLSLGWPAFGGWRSCGPQHCLRQWWAVLPASITLFMAMAGSPAELRVLGYRRPCRWRGNNASVAVTILSVMITVLRLRDVHQP